MAYRSQTSKIIMALERVFRSSKGIDINYLLSHFSIYYHFNRNKVRSLIADYEQLGKIRIEGDTIFVIKKEKEKEKDERNFPTK